jgi:hypothetical protein
MGAFMIMGDEVHGRRGLRGAMLGEITSRNEFRLSGERLRKEMGWNEME